MYPYQIKSAAQYNEDYRKSIEDPEGFWSEIANSFEWKKKWGKVLEWNFTDPHINWFKGARLNITENCLDRHIAENGEATAIIWEPNNPGEQSRKLSYNELLKHVMLFANVLKANGIKKGDR